MVAQVIILYPCPQQETRLIEQLCTCTGILAEQPGYQNSYVIQDPSWETLLLLVQWESQAAFLMAMPAMRAILKHVADGGLSVRDPKTFSLLLNEEADMLIQQKRSWVTP
ncbi:MAG TPA: antibiotic biosynthesis monooxygenase [Ktedonobacterales bacterium]|nr:antibiotic biosynthesis monooxygenase [Ktedonobacterales bacterium]